MITFYLQHKIDIINYIYKCKFSNLMCRYYACICAHKQNFKYLDKLFLRKYSTEKDYAIYFFDLFYKLVSLALLELTYCQEHEI